VTHTDRRDRLTLPGNGPTDEDLEIEIDLTRHEISDTVTELAHRLNVKRRVETAARRNAQAAQLFVREHRAALATGGATLLAAVLVIAFLRR
jgi:hypothetical protein